MKVCIYLFVIIIFKLLYYILYIMYDVSRKILKDINIYTYVE